MEDQAVFGLLIMLLFLSLLGVPLLLLCLGTGPQRRRLRLAACLTYLPAAGIVWFLAQLMIGVSGPTDRVIFWRFAIRTAPAWFILYWLLTLVILGIWVGLHKLTQGAGTPFPWRVVRMHLGCVMLLTFCLALYLGTYTTLAEAVRRGDVELAEKRPRFNLPGVGAENRGIEILSTGYTAEPLLPLAAREGNLVMVQLLLDHGADANGQAGRPSNAPLVGAVRAGRLDIVRLLAESGADPTVIDSLPERERTGLDGSGRKECLEFLATLRGAGS